MATALWRSALPMRCQWGGVTRDRSMASISSVQSPDKINLLVLRSPMRSFQLIELENNTPYGQEFSSESEKKEKVRTQEENQHGGTEVSKERGRGSAPNARAKIFFRKLW